MEHKRKKRRNARKVRRVKRILALTIFAVACVVFALIKTDVFVNTGNGTDDLSGAFSNETPLFNVAEEIIPVINTANIVDYAKRVAAEELTTVEYMLGSRVAITSEMFAEQNAKTYVDLPGSGTTSIANITSCKINSITGNVKLQYELPGGIPESDDDKLYLFELATYATEHGTNYIATTDKWEEGCFLFDLTTTRLYDKYVMAVKKNDTFVDISRGHYITNPEAIAKYNYAYPTASSIKGLIIDANKSSEWSDLGIKQAAYNITIGNLQGATTNANYPTVYYKYNGKTYAFNGQKIAEYDKIFKSLTNKGVVTTVVLLNDMNRSYMQLVHPNARGGKCPYYMFNGAEQSGVEYLAATASFLANRYAGTTHGRVVNWVVGNEVNAREAWNYMNYTSVEEYTKEYVQAYRVIYTAIKSTNANARVYMCLDQMWDRNLSATDAYDAKDVLDAFNSEIILKGNIDYGIAHHSYPVPLTWPKFWDMPANYKRMNLVDETYGTDYITVQNLHVLTDYISQSHFLTEDGEVRSVILNEVGFGSDHGETLQAAAFAYAYYLVDANQHVDGFIINKQVDHPVELAQGLAMGLSTMGGHHKPIYNVFKYIDTAASKDVTAFAKDVIGISDWSQVITPR